MLQNWFFLLLTVGSVWCYPYVFDTQNFKVGIEYDHSIPMSGGSDRYRHRNNYEPFFVTVTARAKSGYVLTYLEVTGTVDSGGQLDFSLIRGQTGSTYMMFQLVSNHSDFLSFSYLGYGIKEEEYKKMANIITLPVTNSAQMVQGLSNFTIFILFSFIALCRINIHHVLL